MPFRSLLLLALTSTSLFAANWNQFRGPQGDGHSTAAGIPTTWSETSNVAWKTAIWGKGWSSPVIWEDQVWLTTASPEGNRLAVLCVDLKTGKIQHDITVFEPKNPQYCHPFNSYASPTPWVEGNRVYVHFGALGTACLDRKTGETIWQRQDLPCNHFRGPGSSVVIHGNQLYLPYDGFDFQYVVALDKRNGKTVWRKNRDLDYGTDNGDRKKAYSTAKVITQAGRTQVVVPGAVATMSYDAASGKELWRVRHGGMNACARPLFANGIVYITIGSGNTLLAVKVNGTGDVSKTHVKWKAMNSVPSRPSQLLVKDSIFMVNNAGVASCLDIKTGQSRWTKRIAGKHVASPVLIGNRIFSFSQEGVTHVFAPEKTFRLLATNKLDGGFMASPAVTEGRLILRTRTHLYAISKK